MKLQNISIRLGMHLSLYFGICLGFIAAALIVLGEYYMLSLGLTQVVATAVALIGGSLIGMGIILCCQRSFLAAKDKVCTCRYRSSINTLCIQYAMYPERDQSSELSPAHDE